MGSEPSASGLGFRTDLYRGTAPFYDRYRPPYPDTLLDDLMLRTGRHGRLLDLACGTGQLAIPLASRFDSVVAADQEAESVDFGRSKASSLGIGNIEWIAGPAESVEMQGQFDLITIGTAFHRLKRDVVAARMMSWLVPGGAVAVTWSRMPWEGQLDWQKVLLELFVDWVGRMGVAERVPAGFEQEMERDPHEKVLRRAGFDYVGRFEFTTTNMWTVEKLAGFMYSTSLLNRHVLGDRTGELENDLAERLLAVEPSGRFREPASYAYELAVAR